ncbi:MAG: hypothetical protein JW953_20985 [Anaerolineae bacterium]|nr:hypothetical protein [Anaerolineae bacterium]
MKKLIHLYQNKYFQWAVLTIIIVYQLGRLIIFVNIYGGVDHDSGWFLGVARSLAERGTYTTLVSTMSDPTLAAGLDMNGEFFQIQDKEGRVYFFAEGTVGPTQVMPDALMIKLFGSGFWQFRVASLLFYLAFLSLASWLLFSIGGFGAAFLFQLIFFFYPHLTVFLGYESLGEVPAITCILASFIIFTKATVADKKKLRWFLLSGLIGGLALTAKLVSLLALSSLGLLWLILYFQKRITLKQGLVTALSLLCFPLIWETIQLIIITQKFGFDTYLQHGQGRLNVILLAGSGLGEQVKGIEFLWYKFSLISDISHPHHALSLITFMLITLAGPWLAWRLRNHPRQQNLVILLWGGWLVHTTWFILLSENGWVRHYWAALILAVLLLSLLWSILWRYARTRPVWLNLSLAVGVTLLLGLNFYSQKQAATFLMSDDLIEYWYQKHLASSRIGLAWMIVPRADQAAVVDVIQQLPSTSRVFYPENYKSAEIAAFTGRIFYPLPRRQWMSPAKDDVLIIGPAVISRWRKPSETKPVSQAEQQTFVRGIVEYVKQQCPQIIFENSNYILCALN